MDLKEVMYYFLIRFIFYDVLEYAKFFLSLFGFCSTLIDFYNQFLGKLIVLPTSSYLDSFSSKYFT